MVAQTDVTEAIKHVVFCSLYTIVKNHKNIRQILPWKRIISPWVQYKSNGNWSSKMCIYWCLNYQLMSYIGVPNNFLDVIIYNSIA